MWRVWVDTVRRQGPPLPPGRRFVETGLTGPSGNHFLTGRFDLLIVGADESGQPAAHVFDWKTGDQALQRDEQSRTGAGMRRG